MPYEITLKPAFLAGLVQLGHKDQKKVSQVVKTIGDNPFQPQTTKILKHTYKNLYRLRAGNYRIVFAVGSRTVALVAVEHRSTIYTHLQPSRVVEVNPVAIIPVPDDREPAHLPDGDDPSDPEEDSRPAAGGADEALLPRLLDLWNVEQSHKDKILSCKTPEELLEIGLPENLLDVLLDLRRPPTVGERMEERTLELPDASDLERLGKGEVSLTAFLLLLDPEQQRAANRNTVGPVLVRGGAGTGKSIVALYRIRSLFHPKARSLFNDSPPKVLFLTYTRALSNASRDLLLNLVGKEQFDKFVTVRTLDGLATDIAGGNHCQSATDSMLGALRRIKASLTFEGTPEEVERFQRTARRLEDRYLVDEFNWVLDGYDIADLNEYLLSIGRVGVPDSTSPLARPSGRCTAGGRAS